MILKQNYCPLAFPRKKSDPGVVVNHLSVVLPIDIENPYRLSNCLYRYISGSWQLVFSDLYRNLPGGR